MPVVFEGRLDEAGVRALMDRAAVVVIPSTRTTEGTPLVAMEAMLAARPLVVTDSPAFRSLVDDGVGVHRAHRRPAAMADAIAGLLADPERAEAMGRAGSTRGRSGRFTATVAVAASGRCTRS